MLCDGIPFAMVSIVAGFRDASEFDVWMLSDQLRQRVRVLVARQAFARHFKLRDQLSSAAESPCPNLTEGFSRYHPKDHARFVRNAKGSLSETIEHLKSAAAFGLIDEREVAELCRLARRARGAATGLIQYLEKATAPHVPRTAPKEPGRPRAASKVPPPAR